MAGRPASLVVVLACAVAPGAQAGWFGGVETGIDATDNVTRAVFDDDVEDEAFVLVVGDGGWRFQPGKNHSVAVSGSLRVAVASQADELTHLAPGVALAWRGKTRLGNDAPRWNARLQAEALEFESEVRQGWLYEAHLGYTRPFGARWLAGVEGSATRRDADSDAFTQDAWAVTLRGDVQLARGWRVGADYRYRDGDVTSTATPVALDPRVQPILDRSTARIPDDAFPGQIAYRLDAESHALGVGFNVPVGASGAVDVRYAYEYTDAGDGIDYRAGFLRATWLRRF